MNLEFEVKEILRRDSNPEKKADEIIKFTNFKKENIIKAIKKGGKKVSEIYGNLLLLEKKK